jgi:exodeoxyribonuclease VII small subunit
MGGAKMAKERFEDALNKLEKVVSRLEEGEIPLEESLKLFEEGIRLSRYCNQKLDEAEKRVEILLKGKNGLLSAEPFEPPEIAGQNFTASLRGEKESADSSPPDSEAAFSEDEE